MSRAAAQPRRQPRPRGGGDRPLRVVAVFLSYNANNGLPFVPTYDVTVQVPDAAGLVRGNEVRIGGKRVGVIEEITRWRARATTRSPSSTLADHERSSRCPRTRW